MKFYSVIEMVKSLGVGKKFVRELSQQIAQKDKKISPVGKLHGSRCYLAGPMDRAPDGGVTWRKIMTEFLSSVGVVVFNPCTKPVDCATEDIETRGRIYELKEHGKYDEVKNIMREIRHIDLRMVDVCDFIVVCLDLDLSPCGTYEEIFAANRDKKPVLIFCPQGKVKIPNWLFGVLPHHMFFDSVEQLQSYLLLINDGVRPNWEEDSKRWVLFNL